MISSNSAWKERFRKEWSFFLELEKKHHEKLAVKKREEIQLAVEGVELVGTSWETTPLDLLKRLPKREIAPLVATVDGAPWDLTRPLENAGNVAFFGFDSPEGREVFWHSSAHLLGLACETLYEAVLVNGPPLEEGFYYDMAKSTPLSKENYTAIENFVLDECKKKTPFRRIVVAHDDLKQLFKGNKYKMYFIEEKIVGAAVVYCSGTLIDLCTGPHLPHAGYVEAFKATKNSSAYFLGDSTKDSLQRLYAIAFPKKGMLGAFLKEREEAEKRDHRKIGRELDLFFFSDMSPGSCFFLPNGTHIYNKLVEFLRSEYRKRGFEEVLTPNLFNVELWKTSGHWENYRENMFQFQIENDLFALKPMNCPSHCLVFKNKDRSYKELPIRMADFGVLHRNELSGALSGLVRVRRFQQDDAHIFCARESIRDEIEGALDFVNCVYGKFGFHLEMVLSTRPEKYMGAPEDWEDAERQLKEALDTAGISWTLNPGDGAFYGPKIDISVMDASKRKHQTATIQLDFQLPERFGLKYRTGEEGDLRRPVIIHRAVLGSIERFIAILVEATAGNFPFWLSPRQLAIIPVSATTTNYALELGKFFKERGFEVTVDCSHLTLNKKIRNAELAHYFLVGVVGEQEKAARSINLRKGRNLQENKMMQIESCLEMFIEMAKF